MNLLKALSIKSDMIVLMFVGNNVRAPQESNLRSEIEISPMSYPLYRRSTVRTMSFLSPLKCPFFAKLSQGASSSAKCHLKLNDAKMALMSIYMKGHYQKERGAHFLDKFFCNGIKPLLCFSCPKAKKMHLVLTE